MKTNKKITSISFLIFLFTVRIALAGEEAAWWDSYNFKPNATEIEGIPIKNIDASWKLATVLTIEAIPKELLDIKPLGANVKFSVDGDFNKDGKQERVLVGVYEEDGGGSGSFLLILSRKAFSFEKATLIKYKGRPGFGALFLDENNNLYMCFCIKCDDCGMLAWDGEKYFMKYAE